MDTQTEEPKPERREAETETAPEALSPGVVHNLELHSLTVREQLLRQWPGAQWETRKS
jgi:hypothetical protein